MSKLAEEDKRIFRVFASDMKLGFLDRNKKFNYSVNTYFIFRDLSYTSSEELYVVILSTLRNLIKIIRFEMKEDNILDVDKTEIFQALIKGNTSKFILVHGHPVGESSDPTEKDVKFMKEIKRMSDDCGIGFEDHLVIGEDGYFSFRDEQILA